MGYAGVSEFDKFHFHRVTLSRVSVLNYIPYHIHFNGQNIPFAVALGLLSRRCDGAYWRNATGAGIFARKIKGIPKLVVETKLPIRVAIFVHDSILRLKLNRPNYSVVFLKGVLLLKMN